jgi:BirA family transcriptional regulator, biotin operon repressor / biotin---[acetyl-CoA-carboxylase] ligase
MRLDPAAAAAGVQLAAHDTLNSTNTEALARARGGERSFMWVTAREQTAGRGRRGNEWISKPGNLYASLLVVDPSPADAAPELSFVAALAVHDAISQCAAALRRNLALKWPNDILSGGKKLAGILIEAEGMAGRLAVAIGIGVNCKHHPTQTSFPATDLATAGAEVAAEDVFFALSGAIMLRLAQWQRGSGFPSIRADWIERAVGIGGDMQVRLPGREFSGRCEGLDERGRLLVRLADGSVQTIAAGDVFPVAATQQGAL